MRFIKILNTLMKSLMSGCLLLTGHPLLFAQTNQHLRAKSANQSIGKKVSPTSSPARGVNATDGSGNAESQPPNPNEQDPKKKAFAYANPEDITNENFPDLIESFDYPNAEITDVIKAISELTGKNFIVDPQVRGKITIIAPTQVTVAEAYKAFLSALAINGYTVVPSGKFMKIKTARKAQRDSIETYSGNYFPNTDQLITRIIKLKYINATDVQKDLRNLASAEGGDMVIYPPTNSIIISDYGSNIERVMSIINQLDVPGFEEQLAVIRIRYAKAKDVADLLDQIINKGEKRNSGRFSPGVPQFRRSAGSEGSGGSGAESYSLVVNDDRTNSIIVVGNKAGISKIRQLIAKLDFRLRPEDQGGVFVYYVRHSEAEQIEKVLNGIAAEAKKSGSAGGATPNNPAGIANPLTQQGARVFGGEVQVAADKNTNSLIITASKQDYEVVKNILAKIDIARDQVFVKAIIMEMNSQDTLNWGIDYYRFDRSSKGVGRMGFRSGNLANLINPTDDKGAILGFGAGDSFEVEFGTIRKTVTSLVGLIRFLKGTVGVNILSTPQIMALDNEEAMIEVGETIPVNMSRDQSAAGGNISTSANREDITVKLVLTPFISPDTDSVKMKIEQDVKGLSSTKVEADDLSKSAVATTKKKIKTQIVVNSGDTAVLGGLMSDKDTEDISKIPILGDIPILGWLFKGRGSEKKKTNLVVFITPKIIRNAQDSGKILDEKIDERINFIQKNMGGRDPHGETIDKLPRRAGYREEERVRTNSPLSRKSNVSPESNDSIERDDSETPIEPLEEPAVESF